VDLGAGKRTGIPKCEWKWKACGKKENARTRLSGRRDQENGLPIPWHVLFVFMACGLDASHGPYTWANQTASFSSFSSPKDRSTIYKVVFLKP
jgi:hypothetical protein